MLVVVVELFGLFVVVLDVKDVEVEVEIGPTFNGFDGGIVEVSITIGITIIVVGITTGG